MDFDFTEQQKMYRDEVRRVVENKIEPWLEQYPRDKPLPKEAMLEGAKMMKPLGALGARLPQSVGGAGLDYVSYGILNEEGSGIHLGSGEAIAMRIYLSNSDGVKKKFIPILLNGEVLAASPTSEPGVGSDPRGIQTKAVLNGDHYVVNGTKLWCSGGSVADILLCQVTLGKDSMGRNLITRLVIERDKSPFEARDIETIGFKRQHLSEIYLEDCKVPKENLVGDPGDAHRALTYTWLAHRPCLGLHAVKLGQKSLDAALSYAKQRTQFGKVIGSFQLVQNMLVEMATLIDASRLLCYRALWLMDKGQWPSKESSMAKWFACESGVRVTFLGMEVHGAIGLTTDLRLEEYYRDARMLTIPDGTTNISKLIVGRDLTGIRAFA